ncbi:hypothetical protein EG328_005817 [Venturia inaequalis]|uniref:Uncharacterized protein n=1 Tax=Venturia inaequalis TaxID=5025 RepID=A0A8H3UL29_VENIN|nr:hypothetical protein EG328_005817 [Venturia inaequalis]RDI80892.1 hypothetical protein Vi05172_g9103 [Venturia inaequalis]
MAEIIQDWTRFITAQFTPSTLHTAYTYAICAQNYFLAALDVLTQSEASWQTIAITLLALLIALKIFSWVVNAIFSWVFLALRLAFWLCVGLFAVYVYQRGPEGMIEDVNGIVNTWTGEYEKTKRNVEYTKAFYDRGGREAPGGRVREGAGRWWG